MRAFFLTLFACAVVSSASGLGAQVLPMSSYWGPGSWLRAGASVAAPFELDAFTTNPAGLMRYHEQSSIGGSWSQLPFHQDRWSVGIVDGRNMVIGGFGFDWVDRGDLSRKGYHLSATYRTEYGAFGASANVYHFSGMPNRNGWYLTQTVGVLVPLPMGLVLAASGRAFLDQADDHILPPQVMTGLSYRKEGVFQFAFQADRQVNIPDQDWNYSFSGDLLFQEFYSIRGGYRMDNSNEESLWSVGLVLTAPRAELAGFYTRTIESKEQQGYGFTLNFLF